MTTETPGGHAVTPMARIAGDEPSAAHPLLEPNLAHALGRVRAGPDARTAARFAAAQFVLGGGRSDVAALRAWSRRHWWASTVQRRGRAGAVLALLKTPARLARDAALAVRTYGPACEAVHGVSPRAQYARLLWLSLTRGVIAESFYDFWLFRPERRRRARQYLQWHEAAVLYRVLAAREAADDFAVLEDKRRFAGWCHEHGLPTAPVLAEFRDGAPVVPDGSLALPERDLFSKPTDQYGGAGIRRWRHVGAGQWVEHDTGVAHSGEALLAALAAQSRAGPVIVQPALANHAAVRPLAPEALCTLRLLTARAPDGAPEVTLATFRTGSGGSASDNFSSGGIAVSVDLASGRLRRGVRRDERQMIVSVDAHPDTGVAFEGFALPQWEEAKTLALAAHARLRAMAFVGWDVAFTDAGLVLLEGNFNPGVRIVQAGWGVPLGETNYLRYLDAHLRRSFARDAGVASAGR